MVKRYQEGGASETDPEDVDFGGILSQLDPTDALLGILTQNMTTTPIARQYSERILNDTLGDIESKSTPESAAIDAMKGQAEQVRQALRDARQRLLAQQYNPGDRLYAIAGALAQGTKFGTIGESAGHVADALRESGLKQQEFNRSREDQLSKLDLLEAQAGSGVTQSQFALEKLQQQLRNKLSEDALKNLGKPLAGTKNPLGNIIPAAAQATDRAFAKEYYLPFINGGSAKAAQGLETLKFASEKLRSGQDTLTGPYVGTVSAIPYLGRGIQDVVWPQGADVRDMIEKTVQESLRPILGSQFTEQEGIRLINRTFNPRLEEWQNADRLDYLLQQLTRAYNNQKALAQYFRDNGTLFGFKGRTSYNVDDFIPPESVGRSKKKPEGANMSEDARKSLLPGSMILLPEDEPTQQAKGGRIRRYQEGGLHLSETDPVHLADEPDDNRNWIETMGDLFNDYGISPPVFGGGLTGLAAEAALSGIQRRMIGKSERHLVDAMDRAGIDPVEAAADVKRGRRAGVPQQLMDVDAPGVQVLAERALQYGGKDATQALEDLRERVEGSRDRVNDRVNKGLKPYDFFQQDDKLLGKVSLDAKRKLFEPVYAKYPGIPQDPVINEIIDTPEGQKALNWAMRFYQNTPGKKIGKEDITGLVRKPSLEFYDYVRKGFDQLINQQEKGGKTEFSEVLRDLRQTLTDRLDALAPNEYKAARQQYAGDLEVRDALNAGRSFDALQPQQIEKAVNGMSFHERNAYRTGAAQKLFEMLDKPSGQNFNAGQRISGSPAMMEKLRPLFDSPAEYNLFRTAVEREAELSRTGSDLVRRADAVRLAGERGAETNWEYGMKRLSGMRYAISPVGWVLRVLSDRPKMNEKQASQMLEVLQRGDPKEMDAFAKTAGRLAAMKAGRGWKSPKRLIGAGLGAGAGYLMNELEQDDATK